MTRWTDKSAAELAELSRRNKSSWPDGLGKRKIEVTGYLYTKAQDSARLTAINKEIAKLQFKLPKKRTTPSQDAPRRANQVRLTLPWPPSVNHYWRRNKGPGMHISAEGTQFQDDVLHACQGADGVMGRVYVSITANPPDRRKRDLDNLLKALLDALNHAGMIEDDGLIDELRIERGYPVKNGRVEVKIVAMD